MPSFPFMTCFMHYSPMVVNQKMYLYYSMFYLPASRIVHLESFIIYRSWYSLLFCRIYESKKTKKILFNLIRSLESLCYFVYLLWNWYALSYQGFNLLYISTYVTYPNQRDSPLEYRRLCKDDSKQVALESIFNIQFERSTYSTNISLPVFSF